MNVRKPLSKRLRFEVFKRDGFKCVYCGATPADGIVLECDHVVPVSDGGADEIENLVTSCFDCNRGKSDIFLDCVPETLESQARRIAEKEAQLRSYREIMEAARERKEEEVWDVATVFIDAHCDDGITKKRFASIKNFLERLPFFDVLEAMELAANMPFGKDRMFRYFCGICWRKIQENEGAK